MKKILLTILFCSTFLLVNASKQKKTNAYNDTISKCLKHEGLFNLWQDTTSGKLYIAISREQLGKEFIYFSSVADAPYESYQFRGNTNDSKIIRFNKKFDRIEIEQVNTNFYFDPSSPLMRAAQANINYPVLDNEKIVATSKDGNNMLIDGDNLFINQKLQQLELPPVPDYPPPVMGTFNRDKSYIEHINNYPQNSEITVKLVFENSKPPANSLSLADPRNITLHVQHSLLEVPKNDFKPRLFDPRIGYLTEQVNDQTTIGRMRYRDLIHRWYIVKKNPDAALSEPVEPITFWIENTTPLELRSTVKEGVESWNSAFEKAGFKNAIVCKQQPDDATWDAGDIRYNVIRWTSSPELNFWAYGPSYVNPRTGQILGADVMIEYAMFFDSNFENTLFKSKGGYSSSMNGCSLQEAGANNLRSALAAMDAMGMSEAAKKEIVRENILNTVEHELGHTFGLTHNFHGSTLLSPAELKDKSKTMNGVGSSVMDYESLNITSDEVNPPLYVDIKPGIYDEWAIEFGYTPSLKDSVKEIERVQKILRRSADPRLKYGNDDDIMRGIGLGTDPDVQQFDFSSDPVTYSIDRCEFFNSLFPKLKEKFEDKNLSYQQLINPFMFLMWYYGRQIIVFSTHVGGVHYTNCFPGQIADKPLEPVKEEIQKKAMNALSQFAFAPDAFNTMTDLFPYLLAQRRGLTISGNRDSLNHDPHLHTLLLACQDKALDNLLNDKTLLRITDSQLYGNTYTIDKMFVDLTNAIFRADAATAVNTIRQNLQSDYVTRLISIMDPKGKYDSVSKSMAMAELKRIDKLESTALKQDALTDAHRAHISFMIKKSFEVR